MKRMERKKGIITKVNLTSLMDVFTILVFFLLVNTGSSEILDPPNQMVLPESKVEQRPRETVVIYIGKEEVVVQGKAVVRLEDLAQSDARYIPEVSAQLAEARQSILGPSTNAVAGSQEVTILADKTIPFNVIQRVMATCTNQGYEHVSLAVVQKNGAVAQI
jgi:biopolymer transport protein ExbD